MGFGYDVNGRMVKATKTSTPDALSTYDAAGMRVAEKVNDVWRFLIYDIGGKLVAEYGGLQSTDEGGVKYVMQDWQGSTRAVVSNSGFALARNDYTAFGEEIGAGVGMRTTAQGFGSSLLPRQKYGLTERDDATGLDHTWFRKNENGAGRWTSPDPYNGSMSLGDPQSFNRYSYVENQPTNYIDPSGLFWAIGNCHAEVRWNGERLVFTGREICDAFWVRGDGGGGGDVRGGVSPAPPPDHLVPDEREKDCVAAAKEAHKARMAEAQRKYDNANTDVTFGEGTVTSSLKIVPINDLVSPAQRRSRPFFWEPRALFCYEPPFGMRMRNAIGTTSKTAGSLPGRYSANEIQFSDIAG